MIRRAFRLLVVVLLAGCAAAPEPTSTPTPVPPPDKAARPLPPAPPAPTPETPLTPAARPRLFSSVTLALAGDINLGTLTLPDGVPPDSGRGLFDAARSALSGDLVVGNFEGVLADSGMTYKCGKEGTRVGGQPQDTIVPAQPPKRARKKERRRRESADTTEKPRLCYAFLTPTALAPRLRDAGFTHLNLANNHANDFGPDGRRSTESLLDSLGIEGLKALVLTAEQNDNVYLSGRNLQRVEVMPYPQASAYDILWSDAVVVEEGALTGVLPGPLPDEPEDEIEVRKPRAPRPPKAKPAAAKDEAKPAAKAKTAKAAKPKAKAGRKTTAKKAAKKPAAKPAKKSAPKRPKGKGKK